MFQREPEKNDWYHLNQQKLEQEQQEAKQEDDIDPTSEEDLDESMDSGTSGEWSSWWVRWVYSVYSVPCLAFIMPKNALNASKWGEGPTAPLLLVPAEGWVALQALLGSFFLLQESYQEEECM